MPPDPTQAAIDELNRLLSERSKTNAPAPASPGGTTTVTSPERPASPNSPTASALREQQSGVSRTVEQLKAEGFAPLAGGQKYVNPTTGAEYTWSSYTNQFVQGNGASVQERQEAQALLKANGAPVASPAAAAPLAVRPLYDPPTGRVGVGNMGRDNLPILPDTARREFINNPVSRQGTYASPILGGMSVDVSRAYDPLAAFSGAGSLAQGISMGDSGRSLTPVGYQTSEVRDGGFGQGNRYGGSQYSPASSILASYGYAETGDPLVDAARTQAIVDSRDRGASFDDLRAHGQEQMDLDQRGERGLVETAYGLQGMTRTDSGWETYGAAIPGLAEGGTFGYDTDLYDKDPRRPEPEIPPFGPYGPPPTPTPGTPPPPIATPTGGPPITPVTPAVPTTPAPVVNFDPLAQQRSNEILANDYGIQSLGYRRRAGGLLPSQAIQLAQGETPSGAAPTGHYYRQFDPLGVTRSLANDNYAFDQGLNSRLLNTQRQWEAALPFETLRRDYYQTLGEDEARVAGLAKEAAMYNQKLYNQGQGHSGNPFWFLANGGEIGMDPLSAGRQSVVVNKPSVLMEIATRKPIAMVGEPTQQFPQGQAELLTDTGSTLKVDPLRRPQRDPRQEVLRSIVQAQLANGRTKVGGGYR